MKKLSLLLLTLTVCFFTACHKDIWAELNELDQRVTTLEELCKEMNTNISALQTIVDVLQSNDYITNVAEIRKDGSVIGYTISFGKHDSITIYHGQNGNNGQNGTNGADGQDGITPIIGVAKDTDGVYYWTLNGEWLLDDNGNKLPVSGKDGANGADGKDGQDGKDGADGQDGKDGITPLLKIEDGYWYVSYDNGTSWTLMGQATGADGQNGQDGANGTDGKDGQDGADGKDGVTPLLKIENGYWYISYDNGATWAQLGKATGEDGQNGTNGTDGKDGQDGANGSNGKDGITPLLKIEDGYWYVSYDNGTTWTQFGKATGADGQNGQNGTDGKDGQNGADGKDGVTPQLKIEEGYWYISYDNGATWTQVGKATGEDGKDGADGEDGKDGQNGADGKDGQNGDSMFQSVTQDENYVYFTLADGTVIKIAKGSASNDQPNSEFIFTITYDPNGGEGVMEKDTFYYDYSVTIDCCQFTKEGYFFKEWNTRQDGTGVSYTGGRSMHAYRNIILYAQWEENRQAIDLGLSVKWAPMNIGAAKPEDFGDYFAWGEVKSKSSYTWNTYKWCGSGSTDYGHPSLKKYCTNYKQGSVDDRIVLEAEDDAATANWGEHWRMPTKKEWEELYDNCIVTKTNQNGVIGYLFKSKINGNRIFFPPTKGGDNMFSISGEGHYWSSSLLPSSSSFAYVMKIDNQTLGHNYRYVGYSIRPVCK